jgi:hypothetical protein
VSSGAVSLLPHLGPHCPEQIWNFIISVQFSQQKEVILFGFVEDEL